MVGYNRDHNVKRGGTTISYMLRTANQRALPSLYSCFELFGEKIALLLIAYNKYARMYGVVSEGVENARAEASSQGEGNILETIKDWDNILEKNSDFRIPTEDVLAEKFKHNDLEGIEPDGIGLLDLANKEGAKLNAVLKGKLDEIKESGDDATDEWRIDKFKKLSTILMATIDACISQDLTLGGAGWIGQNNEKFLLFPGESISSVEGANLDVIVNKQGRFGEEDEGWTSEDCINILARWTYDNPRSIQSEVGDTEVDRLTQIYRVCRTPLTSLKKKKASMLNAIDKLTNIYHRTYLNLIPYLPAHLFAKNIGDDVPKYDTKLQDPPILDLIVELKIQPTDGVEIIEDLWKQEEGEVLLQKSRDRIIDRIYRPADKLADVPGKGFNLHSAYTEEEIKLINEILIGERNEPISRAEYAQYIVDREFYILIDGIKEGLAEIYELDNNTQRKEAYSNLIIDVNKTIVNTPTLDVIRYVSDGEGNTWMRTKKGLAEMITKVLSDPRFQFYIPEDEGDEAEDDESKGEDLEDWVNAATALELIPKFSAPDPGSEGEWTSRGLGETLALQHSLLSDILDPFENGGRTVIIPGREEEEEHASNLVDVPGPELSWSDADARDLSREQWLQLRLNESYFNILDSRIKEADQHLRTARWQGEALFAKYRQDHEDIIEYAPFRGTLLSLFNLPLDELVEGSGARRRYTRHKKHKRKCKKTRRKKKKQTRRKKKKKLRRKKNSRKGGT